MKPQNRMMSGIFLIAMAALLMSPSAAADCVSKCTSGPVGGCASGVASGSGSAGAAGVVCAYNVNIAITVYGDVYQCSATVITTASSCEGDEEEEGGQLLPNLR